MISYLLQITLFLNLFSFARIPKIGEDRKILMSLAQRNHIKLY